MNKDDELMNLDNYERFAELDPQNMLGEIENLPAQLKTAWKLGQGLDIPSWDDVDHIILSGMGGSAIGADLLDAYSKPHISVPIIVLRDYDLPAWASGKRTLVIASSHSGNTEETLSVFDQAVTRGCKTMAIATGGALAEAAKTAGSVLWTFEHDGQPRAAVGYSFGLLLAALAKLDLIPNPEEELMDAIKAMEDQKTELAHKLPATQNAAKRMAGQFYGRWVGVFGSGILAPVARRWKTQISELSKAWAQFEFLPEANHNTSAGVLQPENVFAHSMMMFLDAHHAHPRNQIRSKLTRKGFMLEGLNTAFYVAQGETRLANQWTALHFGDYTAFYLAMAYEVDPTPVDAIQSLKDELVKA
jgi:glucose/mannose-6-phosphate isomerase